MSGRQFLAVFFSCVLAAFSGAVVGPSLLHRAMADPPCGNGCGGAGGGVSSVAAGDASATIGGTASAPTVAMTDPMTLVRSFYATPAACNGASAPNGIICVGNGSGAVSVLNIGKATGAWGGTTSSGSSVISFWRNNGTTDSHCDISLSAGGSLNLSTGGGCPGAITTGGVPFNAGTGIITHGQIKQGGSACSGTTPVTAATGVFACHVTAASSAATMNYTAYTSTPICIFSDETTKGGASLTSVSTTSCVVSTTGATDVVDFLIIGNPT